MKKYVLMLLLLLGPVVEATEFYAEGRVAAFFSTNSRFRRIYDDVNPTGQLEVGIQFCDCYQLFFNVDEFYRSSSIKHCGRTQLNMVTFSFGPKYIFPLFECVNVYAGIGLSMAYSYVNNHHADKEYDGSVGGVAKSGAFFYVTQRVFLDFFLDYNYQPAFHHNNNVGGIRTGVGVGTNF